MNSIELRASSSFQDRNIRMAKTVSVITVPVSRELLGLCTGWVADGDNEAGDALVEN